MSCCTHRCAADAHFDDNIARRDLERYRRKGPNPTTNLMLEGLRRIGIANRTLLDVGAGVGVLHHELLDAGVSTAVHVEASSAYIDVAHLESERRGQLDRVEFVHGDFVEVAGHFTGADIVTLDRVVCCYPAFEPLLRLSAGLARHALAFSIPRDKLFVKLFSRMENGVRRLRGSAFRTFVHPIPEMEALVARLGFQIVRRSVTFGWLVMIWQRRSS